MAILTKNGRNPLPFVRGSPLDNVGNYIVRQVVFIWLLSYFQMSKELVKLLLV